MSSAFTPSSAAPSKQHTDSLVPCLACSHLQRPPPPGLTKKEAALLRKIQRRAHYLDKGINLCGFRVGWTVSTSVGTTMWCRARGALLHIHTLPYTHAHTYRPLFYPLSVLHRSYPRSRRHRRCLAQLLPRAQASQERARVSDHSAAHPTWRLYRPIH